MFTIAEVVAAKPPNSPIATGDYWTGILKSAEEVVKGICRRKLESVGYTDIGYTLPWDNDNTRVYVWYLREPTGTKLTYASLSAFTLDDDTVAEADVTIEVDRFIFAMAGEVKVTYTGGYMTDTTTAKPILLQAVIAAMHIIHRALQEAAAPDFAVLVAMLQPYTAVLGDAPYAERPE